MFFCVCVGAAVAAPPGCCARTLTPSREIARMAVIPKGLVSLFTRTSCFGCVNARKLCHSEGIRQGCPKNLNLNSSIHTRSGDITATFDPTLSPVQLRNKLLRNRKRPPKPKRFRCNLQSRSCLLPFVLVAVHP